MAYGKQKDLAKRAESDKVSRDKAIQSIMSIKED